MPAQDCHIYEPQSIILACCIVRNCGTLTSLNKTNLLPTKLWPDVSWKCLLFHVTKHAHLRADMNTRGHILITGVYWSAGFHSYSGISRSQDWDIMFTGLGYHAHRTGLSHSQDWVYHVHRTGNFCVYSVHVHIKTLQVEEEGEKPKERKVKSRRRGKWKAKGRESEKPKERKVKAGSGQGSNPEPPAWAASALTAELWLAVFTTLSI